MSFCRIKTFRNNGAERKNANDKAIAEKRIRRLKQQLAQSQTGQTPKGRRLGRDKSKTPKQLEARSHEIGLLSKIMNLRRNCTSNHPYTFLDLRGEKQQDCDWPHSAHGDKFSLSPENEPTMSSSAAQSGFMPMTLRPKDPMPLSKPIQRPNTPWYDESQQRTPTRDLPKRVMNRSMRHGGVKVALFHIRPIGFKHISQDDHYIPIYLFERTARDLGRSIAEAVSVDPSKVGQTIWSTVKGLTILVDDDVVANLMEGQKMQVEATKTAPRSQSGRPSSHDSADEVYSNEHGGSRGTRELLDFKLVF